MSKLILPFLATALFITAYILELSDAGRHMDMLLLNFSAKKLLLFILASIALGMLIASFTFRKIKYSERITITISLIFITYAIFTFCRIAIYVSGLTDEYNYFAAKSDLKNGKIQLLYAGQLAYDGEKTENAIDSLKTIYGFTTLNIGIYSRGAEHYNRTVINYLKEKNGKNWHSEYMQKVDSIIKANKDQGVNK